MFCLSNLPQIISHFPILLFIQHCFEIEQLKVKQKSYTIMINYFGNVRMYMCPTFLVLFFTLLVIGQNVDLFIDR